MTYVPLPSPVDRIGLALVSDGDIDWFTGKPKGDAFGLGMAICCCDGDVKGFIAGAGDCWVRRVETVTLPPGANGTISIPATQACVKWVRTREI